MTNQLFSRAGVRYEVALDVLGAIIAHHSEAIAAEREKATPDEAVIAAAQKAKDELRTIRVPSTGQRFYPEIPINLQVGSLDGIPAATSGTVNGRLVTPATGILAFLGDFRLIKWGMVRDIWSEIIEYGDPDNTGKDLKGVNQIAYRTEAMYSYAILDPKGIAVLKKPSATGRAAK